MDCEDTKRIAIISQFIITICTQVKKTNRKQKKNWKLELRGEKKW